MLIRRLGRLCCGFIAALAFASASVADPITIKLTTSALAGTDAILAFDLINGTNVLSSTVTIGDLIVSPDASIGSAYFTHDFSTFDPAPVATSTVTFSDTETFTEYGQRVTLGSSLSFTLGATGTADSPNPDLLNFFLLDSSGTISLVNTSEGTGANTLVSDTVGLPNQPVLFDIVTPEGMTISPVTPSVPEPSTLVLLATAMLGIVGSRTQRCISRR